MGGRRRSHRGEYQPGPLAGGAVVWALDDPRPDGLIVLAYPYVETEEGTVWDGPTTYASSADGEEATFANTVTHEWNHGLGEIVTALLTHAVSGSR